MKTMQVAFSNETKAALEKSAKMTGKAPESLVVEAVQRFLDIEPWQAARPASDPQRTRYQDAMGDELARDFFSEWHVSGP